MGGVRGLGSDELKRTNIYYRKTYEGFKREREIQDVDWESLEIQHIIVEEWTTEARWLGLIIVMRFFKITLIHKDNHKDNDDYGNHTNNDDYRIDSNVCKTLTTSTYTIGNLADSGCFRNVNVNWTRTSWCTS